MGASRLYRFALALGVSVSYFYEDMTATQISSTGTQGFGETKLQELQDDILQGNLLHQRNTLDLVRAYYNISDTKQRRMILELMRSLN